MKNDQKNFFKCMEKKKKKPVDNQHNHNLKPHWMTTISQIHKWAKSKGFNHI
jgi:hypothetical protein